jgi:excisionase family DNA binding protein
VVQGAEDLLTVREAARLLRVSTATIYKLCTNGHLAHIRVSNAIRIPRSALTRVLGA